MLYCVGSGVRRLDIHAVGSKNNLSEGYIFVLDTIQVFCGRPTPWFSRRPPSPIPHASASADIYGDGERLAVLLPLRGVSMRDSEGGQF